MTKIDLLEFEIIDSTMYEAERQISAGRTGFFAISALSQDAGHGRLGRKWDSPPGNLYLTISIPKDRSFPKDHGLTFASALAIADTLHQSGIERNRLSLKWPNDPLVDDRKISGILIRDSQTNLSAEYAGYILVGIGINVISSPESTFFPATSLRECGARDISSKAIRDNVICLLLERFNLWKDSGIKIFIEDYRNMMYGVGSYAKISNNIERTTCAEGVIIGIEDDGSLKLKTNDGLILNILTGDVLPPA